MIRTRLTERLGLDLPIMLAPMALAGGGELAAACAGAGAFGMVGGGYGDLEWTRREWGLLTQCLANTPMARRAGCGFITWKLDQDASALDWVLGQPLRPRAVFLSFGDPRPYASRIAAAGAMLVCQVQSIAQLPQAIEAGAAIVVAQGGEAGGHGAAAMTARSTMPFVPEAADWLAVNAPDVLLLGAGGIADGRGLASVLMLGADGVLVGSRLWASREGLAPLGAKQEALAAVVSGSGGHGDRLLEPHPLDVADDLLEYLVVALPRVEDVDTGDVDHPHLCRRHRCVHADHRTRVRSAIAYR